MTCREFILVQFSIMFTSIYNGLSFYYIMAEGQISKRNWMYIIVFFNLKNQATVKLHLKVERCYSFYFILIN